uniref:Beta-1,3-endoglucanase n=1 Tax=Rhabditophanes sp. KR3021 TaxID=114890 RepID=A0AC35TU34_9BILA
MAVHGYHYNFGVKWGYVFDRKERVFHKLVKAGKPLTIIKKTYPSKRIADNIEYILMNALRAQVTNAESGKPSLQCASYMDFKKEPTSC